ncbi:unnamed protein product, partial [Discosporangium mesarthrocarpum]
VESWWVRAGLWFGVSVFSTLGLMVNLFFRWAVLNLVTGGAWEGAGRRHTWDQLHNGPQLVAVISTAQAGICILCLLQSKIRFFPFFLFVSPSPSPSPSPISWPHPTTPLQNYCRAAPVYSCTVLFKREPIDLG